MMNQYLLIKCLFILTLKHDKEIAIHISIGKSSQNLGAMCINVLDSLLYDLVSTCGSNRHLVL